MDYKSKQEIAALNFFGQFMVRQGIIAADGLTRALGLMAETNKTIGQWAVESGLLTAREVTRIHFEQRISDFFFGEIAVKKNLLTERRVQQLLEKQKTNSLRLGEALIELELLSEQEVVDALRHFQGQQVDLLENEEVIRAITEDWCLAYLIEYFPRLLGRVADRQVKLGAPTLWDASWQYDLHASMELKCYKETAIVYDGSLEQILGIARGMNGADGDSFEDENLLTTVLEELLDFLFIGLEKRAEEEGVKTGSEYEILRGLSSSGFVIPTVTPDGLGSIIIRQNIDPR